MTGDILQFVGTALVIIVAGTVLTRCADAIADLTGLGKLLVGSILLAGATSLPELSVDISAVYRENLPDLAVGDLLGSSLFNLLILAVLDLFHQQRGRMFSRMSAAHALSGTMSMTLMAIVGMSLVLGKKLDFTIGLVGPGSLALLGAYLLGIRLVYYDQRYAATAQGTPDQEVLQPAGHMSLRTAIAGYVAAALVILLVAPLVASAAGSIAEKTGLGSTFVGTTLVALCTSLPELVSTIAAVRLGAYDLAIGNIFGSNAFNMILFVPLDLVYNGALLANVSQTHAVTCLAAILVTSVAIMGQLYHAEKRVLLLEPDAAAIILLVISALAMVYYLP
ncbi:MAG: sodium:calcium antiporter [Gemmataceae bacterium]